MVGPMYLEDGWLRSHSIKIETYCRGKAMCNMFKLRVVSGTTCCRDVDLLQEYDKQCGIIDL